MIGVVYLLKEQLMRSRAVFFVFMGARTTLGTG